MHEPTLDAARRLDERGEHDEALKLLSKCARNGDAQAMRSVALRLMFGDHAPYLPEQGMGLLATASRLNDSVAKAFMAALAGDSPRSARWLNVLECLDATAKKGGLEANLQSQHLRSYLREAKQPTSHGAQAGSPDFPQSGDVLSGNILSSEPLIVEFPNFLSRPICDWLIAEAIPILTRAEIYSSENLAHEESASRTNSSATLNIHSMSVLSLFIQSLISSDTKYSFSNLEALSVLRYRPGEEFSAHYDFLDPSIPAQNAAIRMHGQRVATILIYLNDDFEEGWTEFPDLAIRYKPKIGSAIFFRNVTSEGTPDPRTLHAGLSPVRSEKWVCSQFIRERSILPQQALTGLPLSAGA